MIDITSSLIGELSLNQVTKKGFPLIYKGELSHNITKLFTTMAENKIKKFHSDLVTPKRVYHVMIECLQNITKHSDDFDDKETQIGNGLFIVGRGDDHYYVITGNKVLNSKIQTLEKRIIELNGLKKENLNTLFKKQIREGNISSKGGAGLGLIDIIRKTGHPLEYKFSKLDEESKMFIMKVIVPIKSEKQSTNT